MVDDSFYITPHEAALAAVATSMKKARLSIINLVINSILGGVLFCAGSMLYLTFHTTDPNTWHEFNAFEIAISSSSYAVGLFYVVILGVDLFNSNILYFSIGFLRGAVNIFDVMISLWVSLLGNILGCLFMSYVLVHLSGVSKQSAWSVGASLVGEQKASFSFIQTFIKGIAGNIFVCLAIYLQLLAKPIHVKFLMLVLPVFTFASIGFTHVVADMGVMFSAMLCGAKVSVSEYIWKLLIPATLGNVVGGFVFTFLIPFYLHLVVVENDRKKLSLPSYEARDEQPELNVDSRVVRIPSQEQMKYDNASDIENIDSTDTNTTHSNGTTTSSYMNEKSDYDTKLHSRHDDRHEKINNITGLNTNNFTRSSPANRTSTVSAVSGSLHSNTNSDSASLRSFNPSYIYDTNSFEGSTNNQGEDPSRILKKYTTIAKDGRRHIRSPPGVFPVRGMGPPLLKEQSIQDANYLQKLDVENNLIDDEDLDQYNSRNTGSLYNNNAISHSTTSNTNSISNNNSNVRNSKDALFKLNSHSSINTGNSDKLKRIKTLEKSEEVDYQIAGGYNVNENKPSAKLEKLLSRIITRNNSSNTDLENQQINKDHHKIIKSTQETFPFNKPDKSHYYKSNSFADSMHNSLMYSTGERRKSFRDIGLTERAVMMADMAAGTENSDGLEKAYSQNISRKTSRHSTQTFVTPSSTRNQSLLDPNEKNNQRSDRNSTTSKNNNTNKESNDKDNSHSPSK